MLSNKDITRLEAYLTLEVYDIHTYIHTITCVSYSLWSFGMEIRFIDHFNIQLVITLNYSTTTNFHA